jgi:hypothetical protein
MDVYWTILFGLIPLLFFYYLYKSQLDALNRLQNENKGILHRIHETEKHMKEIGRRSSKTDIKEEIRDEGDVLQLQEPQTELQLSKQLLERIALLEGTSSNFFI